jgi:uncharacterized membrane protein
VLRLRRLRPLRLRPLRRLRPDLLPEPSLAVLLAGAIWVKFAIAFTSPVWSFCLAFSTMVSHH